MSNEETLAKMKIAARKRWDIPEIREKITNSKIGKKYSDEVNKSKGRKGRGLNKSKLRQIIDLRTGIVYLGTKEVSEKLNISRHSVYKNLNGKRKNYSFIQYK